MKKGKDNNNLNYIENPTIEYKTVEYKQSQQQTYDKKAQPNNIEKGHNEDKEIYHRKKDIRVKQFRIYSNPFGIAALLFYIWPVGLYFMWKYNVYNKPLRIILSILMPILGTLRIIGRFSY